MNISISQGGNVSSFTPDEGKLVAWGSYYSSNPDFVEGSADWKQASVGGVGHTIAIAVDGSLWAWGANNYGQLGIGSNERQESPVRVGNGNDWTQVVAGNYHSLGLKQDGSLWAWGRNDGQLGTNDGASRNSPERIMPQTSNWSQVFTGGDNSFAINEEGELWAWGWNNEGQLGNGSYFGTYVPVKIPSEVEWQKVSPGLYHTMGLKLDGSLWVWGNGRDGQLGISNLEYSTTPIRVGEGNDWISIAAGGAHSLAIRADGTLWSWGGNRSGQLGVGEDSEGNTFPSEVPIQVGSATDWKDIAAGSNHSVGIKEGGTLWTWGSNSLGRLGGEGFTRKSSPWRLQIEGFVSSIHSVSSGADTIATVHPGVEITEPQPEVVDPVLVQLNLHHADGAAGLKSMLESGEFVAIEVPVSVSKSTNSGVSQTIDSVGIRVKQTGGDLPIILATSKNGIFPIIEIINHDAERRSWEIEFDLDYVDDFVLSIHRPVEGQNVSLELDILPDEKIVVDETSRLKLEVLGKEWKRNDDFAYLKQAFQFKGIVGSRPQGEPVGELHCQFASTSGGQNIGLLAFDPLRRYNYNVLNWDRSYKFLKGTYNGYLFAVKQDEFADSEATEFELGTGIEVYREIEGTLSLIGTVFAPKYVFSIESMASEWSCDEDLKWIGVGDNVLERKGDSQFYNPFVFQHRGVETELSFVGSDVTYVIDEGNDQWILWVTSLDSSISSGNIYKITLGEDKVSEIPGGDLLLGEDYDLSSDRAFKMGWGVKRLYYSGLVDRFNYPEVYYIDLITLESKILYAPTEVAPETLPSGSAPYFLEVTEGGQQVFFWNPEGTYYDTDLGQIITKQLLEYREGLSQIVPVTNSLSWVDGSDTEDLFYDHYRNEFFAIDNYKKRLMSRPRVENDYSWAVDETRNRTEPLAKIQFNRYYSTGVGNDCVHERRLEEFPLLIDWWRLSTLVPQFGGDIIYDPYTKTFYGHIGNVFNFDSSGPHGSLLRLYTEEELSADCFPPSGGTSTNVNRFLARVSSQPQIISWNVNEQIEPTIVRISDEFPFIPDNFPTFERQTPAAVNPSRSNFEWLSRRRFSLRFRNKFESDPSDELMIYELVGTEAFPESELLYWGRVDSDFRFNELGGYPMKYLFDYGDGRMRILSFSREELETHGSVGVSLINPNPDNGLGETIPMQTEISALWNNSRLESVDVSLTTGYSDSGDVFEFSNPAAEIGAFYATGGNNGNIAVMQDLGLTTSELPDLKVQGLNSLFRPEMFDVNQESGFKLTKSFQIRNDGSANLVIRNLEVQGANSFIIDAASIQTIEPGRSLDFDIHFFPYKGDIESNSIGSHRVFIGSVTIESNDPDSSYYTFDVVGEIESENWELLPEQRPSPVPLPEIVVGPLNNSETGHEYYLLSESRWTEAHDKAVDLGGQLVSINNEAENEWVFDQFANFEDQSRALWIGLTDSEVEGVFKWTTEEDLIFERWIDGAPDNLNGVEHYVHMMPGHLGDPSWNDSENIVESGDFPGVSTPILFHGVVEIIPEYKLELNIQGNGTVVTDPDQDFFEPETELILTANTNEFWRFAGWSGDVEASENPLIVIMDSDKKITANFEERIQEVSYELIISDGGKVVIDETREISDSEGGLVNLGQELYFRASAVDGFEFLNWIIQPSDGSEIKTMDGVVHSASSELVIDEESIILVAGNHLEVQAVFQELPSVPEALGQPEWDWVFYEPESPYWQSEEEALLWRTVSNQAVGDYSGLGVVSRDEHGNIVGSPALKTVLEGPGVLKFSWKLNTLDGGGIQALNVGSVLNLDVNNQPVRTLATQDVWSDETVILPHGEISIVWYIHAESNQAGHSNLLGFQVDNVEFTSDDNVNIIDFESFPGGSFIGGSVVEESTQLSDQLLNILGIRFASESGEPYVAVVDLEDNHASSGVNGIGGVNENGQLDYQENIEVSFFAPENSSIPAVTDFVSVFTDIRTGGGGNIILEGYSADGNLLVSANGRDGTDRFLRIEAEGIHRAIIKGGSSVAWDDLSFGDLRPVFFHTSVLHYFENFESINLGANVDESPDGDHVWAKQGPDGFVADDSGVPGIESVDTDGVTEWAGWSFADRDWWVATADGQGREQFELGIGTVLVADPDEWDDLPHADSEENNWYETYIATSSFNISGAEADSLYVAFSSSWRPEFDFNYRQSGLLEVIYDDQAPVNVFTWLSSNEDPLIFTLPNAIAKDDDSTNEFLWYPLNNPVGVQEAKLNFGMFQAGNDWWWAVDNISVGRPPLVTAVEVFTDEFRITFTEIDGIGFDATQPVTLEFNGETITTPSITQESNDFDTGESVETLTQTVISLSVDPEIMEPGSVHPVIVTFSNTSGESVTAGLDIVVPTNPRQNSNSEALAQAINFPDIDLTLSGNSSWFVQEVESNDGVSAIQSGAISNLEQTTVEAQVQGPGTLAFFWKIESEERFDFLKFRVNGDEVASISGSIDWERFEYVISEPGIHTLSWSYEKDGSNERGRDAAWLDTVSFGSFELEPNRMKVSHEAQSFTFEINGSGSWATTAKDDWVTISPESGTGPGIITVTTLENDSEWRSANLVIGGLTFSLNQEAVLTSGDAVNNELVELTPLMNGAPMWFAQTEESHDGVDALQSGGITHDESTSIQAEVQGPGILTFWWKVESEGSDLDSLRFKINDEVQDSISGTDQDWTLMTYELTESKTYYLEWVYQKDGSVDTGRDAAWLDEISFGAFSVQPLSIKLPSQANSQQVTVSGTGSWSAQEIAGFVQLNIDSGVDDGTVIIDVPENLGDWRVAEISIAGQMVLLNQEGDITTNEAVNNPVIQLLPVAGTAPWKTESTGGIDDGNVLRSGMIPDEGKSSMQAVVSGPGEFSFFWRTDSEENFDQLFFIVDGEEVESISGINEWSQFTFLLDESKEYLIEWVYQKDGSGVAGSDAGYVDMISTPDFVINPEHDFNISANEGGTISLDGELVEGNATSGAALEGRALQLVAAASQKYIFTGWSFQASPGSVVTTSGGDTVELTEAVVIEDPEIEITVMNPISVTAQFELNIYDYLALSREINANGDYAIFLGEIVVGENGPALQNATRITNPNGEWSDLALSAGPEGKSLLFRSDRDGNMDVYELFLEDGTIKRWTNTPNNEHHAEYSPDGQKIVVDQRSGGVNGKTDVWIMDAVDADGDGNGDNPVRLTTDGWNYFGKWSPDGQSIAFRTDRNIGAGVNSQIFVMDADGENETEVTGLGFWDTAFDWRSNGEEIVFQRDSRFRAFDTGEYPDLWSVNLGTGEETNLTQTPNTAEYNPVFSADEQYLVFSSYENGPGLLPFDISILDLASGQRFALTENPLDEILPVWVSSEFEIDEIQDSVGLPETLFISLNSNGSGSVEVNPDQIIFELESEVTLTATPDEFWRFIGWSGDVESTDNPLTITMDSNQAISANFEEIPRYALEITFVGNGSVSSEPALDLYEEQTEVTLTATPDEFWRFIGWSGDVDSTENPLTVTIDSSKSIAANFEEIPMYDFNISGNEGGTISLDGELVEGNTTSGVALEGRILQLVATVSDKYLFAGWAIEASPGSVVTTSGGDTVELSEAVVIEDQEIEITVMNPISVEAQFELNIYDYLAFSREVNANGDYAIFLGEIIVGENGPELQNATRITNPNGEWSDLALSAGPEGKSLLFRSDRDGNMDVYELFLEDGTIQRWTNTPNNEHHAEYSPDGQKIVVDQRSGAVNGKTDVWIMDAVDADGDGNGDNPFRLTTDGWNYFGKWSPNGESIAFRTDRNIGAGVNSQIFVMDADGENETEVTGLGFWDTAFDWRSNGEEIVFQRDSRFRAFDTGEYPDLWSVNLETGEETNLTQTPNTAEYNPVFSTDEQYLVFSSYDDGPGMLPFDITLLDLASGQRFALTENPLDEILPVWVRNQTRVSSLFFNNQAPTISAEILNGEIVISWPAGEGFILQSVTRLDESWNAVEGVEGNTYRVKPDGSSRFFRLIRD